MMTMQEEPTAKGDRVAGLMREHFEQHKCDRWDGVSADNLMIGLLNIALREYRSTESALTVTELDKHNEAMVCTGCGTTKTAAFIRANSDTALTCCPERKMIPVRDVLPQQAPTGEGGMISALEQAFVTSVAEGHPEAAERRYRLVFSFPTMKAMQEAHSAWVNRKAGS